MKTLDEVEPRTPIAQADVPLTILQSGSYYLTENLAANAIGLSAVISIAAEDVHLDLMGFSIEGSNEVAQADHCIELDAFSDGSVIRNGTVYGALFAGIDGDFGAIGVTVEDIVSRNNSGRGIQVGAYGVVRRCTVFSNTQVGIETSTDAMVVSCTVNANGRGVLTGRASVIRDVTANDNGLYGIFTSVDCVLENVTAWSNDGVGIETSFGCTISRAVAAFNTGDGIKVDAFCVIATSASRSNGGDGFAMGIGSSITDSEASSNTGNGIDGAQGSLVRACTASSNSFAGIRVDDDSSVIDCVARFNDTNGIQGDHRTMIRGNACAQNGDAGAGAGIRVTGDDGRVEGNMCSFNVKWGISIGGTDNLIARNSCANNGAGLADNYTFAGGNEVGTEVNTPVGAGAWDNISH
ncbi:MAG: hypothetical protein ACF8GE_07715 [Phycisphaerales bacterium JB043]